MKVSEVITRVKNGESMSDIAKDTDVTRSALTKKMNKIGFVFDRAVKEYNYMGDHPLETVLDFDLNNSVSTLGSRNIEKNSREIVKNSRNIEKNSREIVKDSGKTVTKMAEKIEDIHEDVPIIREREGNTLTEEEIMFVKELHMQYKKDGGMYRKIFLDTYSDLPNRKPNVKAPYMISKATVEEFDQFMSALSDDFRITRNDLAEMALRYFVQEFQPLLKQKDCTKD
ncbi:hypothetical protein CMALT430_490016 [Carnobacterium maltaromaticum]|uniref:hypothetical protein n=1 Tax=Carnobacterium maltaromaticum TaxID=2751 RepID=UPI00191B948B|nr:hypothetical protein [Carnobacterium maltaromaticum]CAD5901334.1 hypothetical protein CMALT430_490016 [Carnobacterium maltaromaticum]